MLAGGDIVGNIAIIVYYQYVGAHKPYGARGGGFSVADGTFKPAVAAICLVFAVLCQIASNFANEYYDFKAARDRRGRQGPRRGVTEGEITPAAMKRALFIINTLAPISPMAQEAANTWLLHDNACT